MVPTSELLKIVRGFQAMFALLVLGLAANSVNFYTAGPSDERASGAPLATAGCSLCILAAIATIGFVLAQKQLADVFAVIIWAVACGVMAAGSAVVNKPSNGSCNEFTHICSPITSAVPWATGVAAAVFAGLQSVSFLLSSVFCFHD